MQGYSRRKTLVAVIGVMLGMLLAAMDQTVVGTALPRVVAQLGGMDLYSWVFTAYMLASTTTVPIFGKLSDLYGRKPFYLAGLAIFMVGSILCGVSQSMVQLIIFRGIQGLGAGAIMSISFIVIGDLFPPAERGKWQGLMGAVFGIASVVGPALGGYITDNLSWRWVFYVNLPIGVLAVAVFLLTFPRLVRAGARRSLDYWGVTTLILAIFPLLLAFAWATTRYGWVSPQTLGLLAFSAIMIGVFLDIERRAPEPIIPPSLFRNSIFSISTASVFLTGVGMFGTIMFLPLFVQGVLGSSATSSGLVLTPLMLSLVVSATLGGQLISRTGHYRVLGVVGLLIAAIGLYLLSLMGTATSHTTVVRNMVIVGFGLGLTMPTFIIAVQNALPYGQLGVVTSSIQFFRSIGGTIGVAVMGSLLNSQLAREIPRQLPEALRSLPPEQLSQLANPQVLVNPEAQARLGQALSQLGPQGAALLEQLLGVLRGALAASVHSVFLLGMALVALAFGVSFFLKEIPLRQKQDWGGATAPRGKAAGEAIPGDPPGKSAASPH